MKVILLSIVTIGLHILDVGSDCFAAYSYFANQDYWWFGLTVAFIIIPAFIMTVLSWVAYGDSFNPISVHGVMSIFLLGILYR